MTEPPALFFDVGGVLLTNAWDTAARTRAAEAFGLDNAEFQTRHGMLKTAFEVGRLSLNAYVQKTVFYRSRSISPDDFKAFMFSQSQPLPEALDWVRALGASGRYRLYTLNNESRELHEYRDRTFRLRDTFRAFFTSCYLGAAKPDEEIYLNALGISGCPRDRAVFIDDRAVNVEAAAALGLHTIHYTGLEALRAELIEYGVEA